MKLTSNRRLLEHYINPFFLILLWAALSLIFNSYGSFSVLTYPPASVLDHLDNHTNEIHKGEIIHGDFVGRDDYMGIISVRFNTFKRINSDVLLFRIKEKGRRGWYYENVYRVDQFQPDQFFTFGFPIIKDAKGKKYEFTLTSTRGSKGDAVAISDVDPQFVTKYQYPKQLLLSNKKLLVGHVLKLYLETFSNRDFFISSIIYLLPFFFYLLRYSLYSILQNLAKKHTIFHYILNFFIPTTVVLLLCINILIVKQLSSGVAVIILIGSWLLYLFRAKLDAGATFAFAVLFFLSSQLGLVFHQPELSERAAQWTFYFLGAGSLQRLWEFYIPQKQKATLMTYIRRRMKMP